MENTVKKRGGKEPPDAKVLKIFSTNLRSCIKTNEWLAGETGLSPQAIADYVNGISLPRADYLLKISNAVNKPMDWLLTGRENIDDEFMCEWDEQSRSACQKLKEILDSGDKFAVPAILSNIDAFRDSVEKNERLDKLENAVNELRKKEKYDKKLASLKLSTDTD